MRKRKVRGHKRRWKKIENWKKSSLHLDLDYLVTYQKDYVKFRIRPWSSLSLRNSVYSDPEKRTKDEMIAGLCEIYEQWKIQLDKIGEPYYLKIWLYEDRPVMSQVVCAVGEYIDFYENTFNKPEKEKHLNPQNYSNKIKPTIELFNWECHLDEDTYDNTNLEKPEDYSNLEDFLETKKWFDGLMKKPHKTVKLKEPIGDMIESYLFEKGTIWIGEKK